MRRFALPVLCLALGSGATVGFARYLVPTVVITRVVEVEVEGPAAKPEPKPTPAPSDEVVVEIRVRVPPEGKAGPSFSKDRSTITQGALVNTQNPFDLAIEGDGFFQVVLPSGDLAYTRVGNFGINAEGSLITSQGYRLSPEIKIPPQAVSVCVGTDGTFSVQNAGALNASTVVGQIELTRFLNPGWLTTEQPDLFQETPRSGSPLISTPGQHGLGFVRQGFRERHSDNNAAALIELIRDLGRETNNNADGNGVRVKVKRPGTE